MKLNQIIAMLPIRQAVNRQGGFTLVEIFIALGIAGIVLLSAMPSLRVFLQDNRMAAQVNRFVGSIHYARSMAVTTRSTVIMCKSASGSACQNGADWEDGWIVYEENTGNTSYGTGGQDPDVLLRVFEGLKAPDTIRGNNNVRNYIAYTPDGFTGNNGSLVFCDDRGFQDSGADARVVVINQQGRPYTASGEDSSLVSCSP